MDFNIKCKNTYTFHFPSHLYLLTCCQRKYVFEKKQIVSHSHYYLSMPRIVSLSLDVFIDCYQISPLLLFKSRFVCLFAHIRWWCIFELFHSSLIDIIMLLSNLNTNKMNVFSSDSITGHFKVVETWYASNTNTTNKEKNINLF